MSLVFRFPTFLLIKFIRQIVGVSFICSNSALMIFLYFLKIHIIKAQIQTIGFQWYYIFQGKFIIHIRARSWTFGFQYKVISYSMEQFRKWHVLQNTSNKIHAILARDKSKHIHQLYKDYGCGVFKRGVQNWKDFCLKINISKGNY